MKPHIPTEAIERWKEIITVEQLEFFYHCGLLSGLLSPGDSWRCLVDQTDNVLSFEAVRTVDINAAVSKLHDGGVQCPDGCLCIAHLNESDEAVSHRIADFPKCELDQRMKQNTTAVAG